MAAARRAEALRAVLVRERLAWVARRVFERVLPVERLLVVERLLPVERLLVERLLPVERLLLVERPLVERLPVERLPVERLLVERPLVERPLVERPLVERLVPAERLVPFELLRVVPELRRAVLRVLEVLLFCVAMMAIPSSALLCCGKDISSKDSTSVAANARS